MIYHNNPVLLFIIIFTKEAIEIIIYKITCLKNGKIYIGQTSETIEKRFKRHIGYQKDNNDTKFYRAIKKYGPENFVITAIDYSNNQEELDAKEIFWINFFDSVHNGYNTKETSGKCGGDTLSNHPNKEEISEKIRLSKLGNKNPMRINGGLKGERNGMFGKRGKNAPSHRECLSINKHTNEIKFFDTLKDMQNFYGVTTLGMVSNRCSGHTKSDYKGFYFKYKDDYEESQTTIENVSKDKNE